jgi:hypothetical protein
MPAANASKARVFKTAWFSKVARKARIPDSALCACIDEAMRGQADDLGGGVYKKRLNRNMHRAIVLAKAGRWWILEYLFAKKDRANIEDDELAQFRELTKAYGKLGDKQIQQLIDSNHFVEICNDDQDQIQD